MVPSERGPIGSVLGGPKAGFAGQPLSLLHPKRFRQLPATLTASRTGCASPRVSGWRSANQIQSQAKFLDQVLPAPPSRTPGLREGLMDVECPRLDGLPGKGRSVSEEAVQTSHHSLRRPRGSCAPWPPSLQNALDQTAPLGCFCLRKALGFQQEPPG